MRRLRCRWFGRKLDRRRVYEIGYRRGLREAQALADAIFGEPADRVNPSKPKGERRR